MPLPMMTSFTLAASILLRSTAALTATCPSWAAVSEDSPPRNLPCGVRALLNITASRAYFSAIKFLPDGFQFTIGVVERIGNHAGISNRTHKVRISRPARDDMKVIMLGDARTCRRADICAQIKRRWIVQLAQRTE